MRLLATIAIFGTSVSIGNGQSQDPPEPSTAVARPQAAPARATARRSESNKPDMFDEWGPGLRRASSQPRSTETRAKQEPEPAAPVQPPAPPPPAPLVPTVAPAPAGPPPKEPTAEEFASIHVGASEKEMLGILGPPSSRVSIPDDDGHLRETCQYWVKGSPVATIRLDNGRVAKIEIQRH